MKKLQLKGGESPEEKKALLDRFAKATVITSFENACMTLDYEAASKCFSSSPTLCFNELKCICTDPINLEKRPTPPYYYTYQSGQFMVNLVNYLGDHRLVSPPLILAWYGDKNNDSIKVTFQIGVPQYYHQESMVIDAQNQITHLGNKYNQF